MSFDTEVVRNGHGGLFQLETSYDHFASITYFYATLAHHFGAVDYDPRIVSIGRVTRGLTVDHNLAASTVEVVLDNTDGQVDYLVNRSTVESNLFKGRFRLYAVAYDPATLSLQRKLLGQFGCLDFPRRTMATVTLMLADDTMIDGAEFALSPSIKDWVTDASSTHTNNPLCKANSTLQDDPLFYTPYDAPLQLAFGNVTVDCQKTADFDLPTSDTNFDRRALIVCATTDTGVVTTYDIEHLYLKVQGSDPVSMGLDGIEVPKSFTQGPFPGTIWTASRSQSLSKDGRTWKLIWVDIHMRRLLGFLVYKTTPTSAAILAPSPMPNWLADPNHWQDLYRILDFAAAGWPYSSRTVPSSAVNSFGSGVRCPEIAYDLLAYYSHGLSTADVDLASFQRAAGVLPGFYASGILDNMAELGTLRDPSQVDFNPRITQNFATAEATGGRLRQVLADLGRSGTFDIFVSWGGVFTASAQTSTFADQTATLPTLFETLIVNGEWEDKIPSPGERWAPHNRLYIEGVNGRIGPFDNAAAVAAWGRKLPFTLSTKWVSPSDYASIAANPNLSLFNVASLESKARQRLRFTYGSLEALQLDIGSYFRMSLSRSGSGLAALFSSAVFKVEQIDLIPSSMVVYIEAIWFDDLLSDVPYLLDDESFTVRVASGGGRTVTVQDSNATATFSLGSLVTDGVVAGDILILEDATLAANVFTRFRCLRVSSRTDATHLVLTDPDLNFGSPGGIAVTNWEIRRGFTTYPTVITDAAHYPSGSAFYGKVTNASGQFSDLSAGNKLLDG